MDEVDHLTLFFTLSNFRCGPLIARQRHRRFGDAGLQARS